VVHGREALRVHAPLPPAGSLDVRCGVTQVVDKGPGGHVFVDLTSNGFDLAGRLVVERTITVVLRGAGGSFGSETWTPPRAEGGTASLRVPSIEAVLRPAREPDLARTFAVDEDLPLVYRLSGDRNPLHSDPWFATVRAGFPRTILHGLCTLGIAGRTLLHDLCEGDPAQFVAVSARFAAPVFPGETLTTKVWGAGDAGSAFEVWASGNEHAPERPVLDSGVCMRRASTREDES
jgi:acyl dehydratase